MHFQIENFIIFCFSLWNIIASKLHLILLKSIMRKWQKCHHIYIHIEAADDINSVRGIRVVEAELSYNPYLQAIEIRISEQTPRINSHIEIYQNKKFYNWIHKLPYVFRN